MNQDFFLENKKHNLKIINISKAGQLSILLSDLGKKNIEELAVIGNLNGSDFKIIRDMATNNKLSFIDLSETNIVSGGDYYYASYSTKNNEFGYSLFNGCEKLKIIILPKQLRKLENLRFGFVQI